MKGLPKLARRIFRDRCGATAVEFAILGNVFFMFLIAICYLGLMYYHSASLNYALEQASRLATTNTSTTQSNVQSAVNSYLSAIGLPDASVTYSVGTASGVTVATISASMTEAYTVPFFNHWNITYTSSTQVPQSS